MLFFGSIQHKLSQRTKLFWTTILGSFLFFLGVSAGYAENAMEFSQSDHHAICSQVETALTNGRGYFMASIRQSYKSVTQTQNPIQADLYILAHFLMYQKQARFTQSQKEEDYWTRHIVQYFSETFKKGLWEIEGCLMIKVLIGFENQRVHQYAIEPMTAYYADLIKKKWKGEGVGECFSQQIERTYGNNMTMPVCTGVNPELDAKVAYYQAITKYQNNMMLTVTMPSLNQGFQKNLRSWFEILPEMWVIMTYPRQLRPVVSHERYQVAISNVQEEIQRLRFDQPMATSAYLDLLLYSYLLTSAPITERTIQMVQTLLSVQLSDGSFPVISNVRAMVENKKHHNVYATPTYFAVLGLNEFKKRYSCP